MFTYFSKRKTNSFAKSHYREFIRLYSLYSIKDYERFISQSEKWLCSFPNSGSDYSWSNWSHDPYELTTKNFVFFSNTLYFALSIATYMTGDYKKSLHYRVCMGEFITYSECSGQSEALAWRLLNLSIRRDSKIFDLSEYSNNIRKIGEEELSNVGAYGKFTHQVPRTFIDYDNGLIVAVYPEETITVDFRVTGTLVIMLENIASWICSQSVDYDWSGQFPFKKDWLSILDRAHAKT